MLHFVTKPWDPAAYDPEEVCKEVFDADEPYLAVLEREPEPHVHFQGKRKADFSWGPWVKEHNAKHSKRVYDKNCRPTRVATRKEVDSTGYQYMNKQGSRLIVANNGFSESDLDELKAKSDEYVAGLKASMGNYIQEHFVPTPLTPPEEAHAQYRYHGLRFYAESDTMPPPNFQKLVLWALARACPEYLTYVSEKI